MFAFALIALAGIAAEPASAETALERIKTLALEATRAASESITRGTGEGVFERKVIQRVDGHLRDVHVERGRFAMAFSGVKDFIKLQFDSTDAEHTTEIYVNDGGSTLGSQFSPRILIYGAEGRIFGPGGDLAERPDLFGLPPHRYAAAWTFSERVREGAQVTLEEKGGVYVIKASDAKNGAERFFVDPKKGYLVTRFELSPVNGQILQIIEKDWAKTAGGLWYVKGYLEARFPRRDKQKARSWRYEFNSFDANPELPDGLFTVDALALPAGARIIDERVVPNEDIIVQAPETDMAALERIVGELPKSGVRAAPRRGTVRWILIGAGVVLLGFGVVTAGRLWRARRNHAG